jgi:pimeloyl-ACP methyl ester carboxylesterase
MFCIDSIYRNNEYIHFLNVESDAENTPIIVFLHGFPDNAFVWDLQLEALKGKYHLIAPFIHGTLEQRKISEDRILYKELHQDLKDIILKVRKSSEQKVYLVSHDLGSCLSASFLNESDFAIDGLVHINGLGLEQFLSRKYNLRQWIKSYYIILFQSSLIRMFVGKIIPKFFMATAYNLSNVSSNDNIRSGSSSQVFNNLILYKHLLKDAFRTLFKKQKKIQTPTLFIWGKDDLFLNIPTVTEVDKFYKKSTIRLLEGGHWTLRTNFSHVNKILFKTFETWSGSYE